MVRERRTLAFCATSPTVRRHYLISKTAGRSEVDESWQEGKWTTLTIHNIAGDAESVRSGGKTATVKLARDVSITRGAEFRGCH